MTNISQCGNEEMNLNLVFLFLHVYREKNVELQYRTRICKNGHFVIFDFYDSILIGIQMKL